MKPVPKISQKYNLSIGASLKLLRYYLFLFSVPTIKFISINNLLVKMDIFFINKILK